MIDSEPKVAVLIATLWRKDRLQWLAENFRDSTHVPAILYFIAESHDLETIEEVNRLKELDLPVDLFVGDFGRPHVAVNHAFDFTDEPIVCFTGDDVEFFPGWLEEILALFELEPETRVIAAWDGHNENGKSLYAVKRSYIQEHGVIDEPGKLFCSLYCHTFVDNEFFYTAKHWGVFSFCPRAQVKHHNWTLSSKYAKDRTTDHLGEISQAGNDRELYESRRHLFNGGY